MRSSLFKRFSSDVNFISALSRLNCKQLGKPAFQGSDTSILPSLVCRIVFFTCLRNCDSTTSLSVQAQIRVSFTH